MVRRWFAVVFDDYPRDCDDPNIIAVPGFVVVGCAASNWLTAWSYDNPEGAFECAREFGRKCHTVFYIDLPDNWEELQ